MDFSVLDVEVKFEADYMCCYCPTPYEAFTRHLPNCAWWQKDDEYDDLLKGCRMPKGVKRSDKFFDAISKMDGEQLYIFQELSLNHPLRIDDNLRSLCYSCQTYEQHLHRNCLRMSRVDAYDIAIGTWWKKAWELEFQYVHSKVVERTIRNDNLLEDRRVIRQNLLKNKFKSLKREHYTARQWRHLTRHKNKEIMRFKMEEEEEREKMLKIITDSEQQWKQNALQDLMTIVQTDRAILQKLDDQAPAADLIRFRSTTTLLPFFN